MGEPSSHGRHYDATRFADKRARTRFAVMERHVLDTVRGRSRILDLGCGTGRLTARLEGGAVYGIDRALGMLERARARGLAVVLGDANALPFAAASFDALVSTDSAFGLFDWSRALAECARVLTRSGILVVHLRTHAIWSPRAPFERTIDPSVSRDRSGPAFIDAAAAVGLSLVRARLWRWLRVYPYLVAVPARLTWPLWSHGIVALRKR